MHVSRMFKRNDNGSFCYLERFLDDEWNELEETDREFIDLMGDALGVLAHKCEWMELQQRTYANTIGAVDLSDEDRRRLQLELNSDLYNLRFELHRLFATAVEEERRIDAEREAAKPKEPAPIGIRMVVKAMDVMRRPNVEASDEWSTLCERAIEDFNRIAEAQPADAAIEVAS